MKAFTFNDLLQYASTLRQDKDDMYTSQQELANDFLRGFEVWLERKDLPEITLPAKADGLYVYDANNKVLAECLTKEMARAMTVQLNKDYVPTEEQRIETQISELSRRILDDSDTPAIKRPKKSSVTDRRKFAAKKVARVNS